MISRVKLADLERSKVSEQSKAAPTDIESLIGTLCAALQLTKSEEEKPTVTLLSNLTAILPLGESTSVLEDLRTIRSAINRLVLEEAFEVGSVPFRQSKLMIVGEGAAGKSSFFRALTNQLFYPEWKSTLGVVVADSTTLDEAAMSEFKTVDEKGSERVEWKLSDKCERETKAESGPPNDSTFLSTAEVDYSPCLLPSTKNQSVVPSRVLSPIDTVTERVSSTGDFSFCNNDASAITFSCWDYDGQRVFQTLQHLFMSRMGVYLVVFDMRKLVIDVELSAHTKTTCSIVQASVVYLRFWLQQIQMLALGAPIFLVGTHLDKVKDTSNISSISNSLFDTCKELLCWKHVCMPPDSGLVFFPVDNFDKYDPNIAILRELINEAALSDPEKYIDRLVPVSWLNACGELRKIEREGSSYLSKGAVEAIARKFSIVNSIDISAMLLLFHQLGIVLYYDEYGLDDTAVLNPQWLVDMAAGIIRDFELQHLSRDVRIKAMNERKWLGLTRKGVLARSVLNALWEEERGRVDFLLFLFKKFLLICDLTGVKGSNDEYYLVPSIVKGSGVQPSRVGSPYHSAEDFLATITLTFSGFLPDGFLPRLIVTLTASNPGYFEFTLRCNLGDGIRENIAFAPCLFYYDYVFSAGVAVDSYPVVMCQDKDAIYIYVTKSKSTPNIDSIRSSIDSAVRRLCVGADAMYRGIVFSISTSSSGSGEECKKN